MKKMIALFTLLLAFQAQAGVISVGVSDSTVAVGESVQVDLIATGFADFDTFDFDLDFDTSVFSFDAASLTSDLLAFSPLLFEVNQVTTGIAFSFLDFFPVNGDLVLASFSLDALADGSADFVLSDVIFADSFMQNELLVDSSATARASVQSVPAPSTVGMMVLALGFILRKRF